MKNDLIQTFITFVEDFNKEKQEQGFIPTIDLLLEDLNSLVEGTQDDDLLKARKESKGY